MAEYSAIFLYSDSMKDSQTLEQAKAMARVLANASGASEVFLFGSRARGNWDTLSDWDFLLVLPDGEWMQSFDTELEVVRQAQNALWEAGFDVYADVIPMSLGAYQKGNNVLARVVWKEGISLLGAVYLLTPVLTTTPTFGKPLEN